MIPRKFSQYEYSEPGEIMAQMECEYEGFVYSAKMYNTYVDFYGPNYAIIESEYKYKNWKKRKQKCYISTSKERFETWLKPLKNLDISYEEHMLNHDLDWSYEDFLKRKVNYEKRVETRKKRAARK